MNDENEVERVRVTKTRRPVIPAMPRFSLAGSDVHTQLALLVFLLNSRSIVCWSHAAFVTPCGNAGMVLGICEAEARTLQTPALQGPRRTSLSGDGQAKGPQTKRQSLQCAAMQLNNACFGEIMVHRPQIRWTVPGTKPGWKDENGKWFDEDGPRNGPPMNYWRQSLDERTFNDDMRIVNDVLRGTITRQQVAAMEQSRGGKHSINRRVLGRWAPVSRRDERIAIEQAQHGKDPKDAIFVPYTIEIFRTAGRKFGPKTYYGQFDAHLQKGEELTIKAEGDRIDFSGVVLASPDNEVVQVGLLGAYPLTYGGITYLSDYIMIMRDAAGAVDVWLRVYEGSPTPNSPQLAKQCEAMST